jgi:hypothetical protein
MVLPGLGHFYCGLKLRGALVMGFSVAGMAIVLGSLVTAAQGGTANETVSGLGLATVVILYAFGSIDAYFSAREVSRGIDPRLMDNPRIACFLNLLTRGWGYFYLGERVKGIVVFVILGLLNALTPQVAGGGPRAMATVSLVTYVIVIALAFDAYRIGDRSFKAAVAGLALPPEPPPSRLPPFVPLVITGAITLAFGGLMLLGTAMILVKGGRA